ncbi:MAG: sulfotransferase domain-containing protein [Salibacteraceae bacterium]
MQLPNTIIIGAPKSGSSSLYWWLSAHPEVCASKTKETHFFDDEVLPRFNAKANVIEHDLEKYAAYFSHCSPKAKVVMEATPIYLYQKNALNHLAEFNPKPRIILVLREPSQRAHSQFRFNKYRLGNVPFSKPYQDYLSETANTNSDPIERGKYMQYIDRWLEHFDKNHIHIIQLEKLQMERVSEMKRLASFLSIDDRFYDSFDFMKRNETRKMKSTKLHRLGLKVQPLVPRVLQDRVLVPLYLKLNSTAMPALTKSDLKQIEEMKSLFKPHNESLASQFPEIDLSLWR